MKKFLFGLLALAGGLVSCTETVVQTVYVPCEFSTSAFVGEIEEAVSLKSVSLKREITCHFPTALGSNVFTVAEGERFVVELPVNEVAKAQFVYADQVTPDVYNTINLSDTKDKLFAGTWEGVPVAGEVNTITLRRVAGEFVAKAGSIPSGYSLNIDVDAVRTYDWVGQVTQGLTWNASGEAIPYRCFVVGAESTNVAVTVRLLNQNNTAVKQGSFTYSVPRNVRRTVTYHASYHVGGGFEVVIEDQAMADEESEDTIA